MNLLEVIVLGLVQGLTEFIPISSSGHLVIAQSLFGHESDHLLLEGLNIGTFLALLIFFMPKIIEVIKNVFKYRDYRLARNIVITSVPAGLVGYMLSDFINTAPFFGSLVVVMVTLFVVGLVMIVLERLPKLSETKDGSELSGWRAFLIGLSQMLALIPGVSRSGATIITGRLSGLSAKGAAEYSFLASLPIMFGVTLKFLISDGSYISANASSLLVGNIVAFISGIIAVRFLLGYLANHSLALFGWYRVVLAVGIGVVLLIQL